MTRPRPGLVHSLALALTGAATTWLTLLAWRGFTEDPSGFLVPLAALGLLVAITGALGRWARWYAVVVVAVQLVVVGLFLCAHLAGSVVPGPTTLGVVREALAAAVAVARDYASPVPADAAPGVHPLLVVSGALCLVLVDLAAGTLRRAAVAGLPLLVIYTVPVSLLAGVTWWVFALGAGGYCLLLVLQETDRLARWGRTLAPDGDRRPGRVGGPLGAATTRGTTAAVASAAVTIALVAPHLLPTLSLQLVEWGRGSGGGNEVTLENPMADLRRDLRRGNDVPLVRVRTDEPDPAYLRIAVLNRFSGNTWSSGDRQIPETQTARGVMPPLKGVRPRVPREQFTHGISVTDDFTSTWLPTPAPISRINAAGAWRYDLDTMDFLASEDDLSTEDMRYSATAVRLELDAVSMARSPRGGGAVAATFTDLPDDVPEFVEELTDEVVGDAESDFEKAVALQRWFREEGGFEYSLEVDPGNGTDELVAFLREGPQGRVGYCEQFASAMAVMARVLGIPSRVAVGFLRPDRVSDGLWEYSAHDLHAWTEVYISGAGWVRFEPTPAARASDVPGYTTQIIPAPGRSEDPALRPDRERPDNGPDGPGAERDDEESTTSGDQGEEAGFPWLLVVTIGVGLALAALLLLPRARRRSRRHARWTAGTAEAAWRELRDSVVDLGLRWPAGRSPRATALIISEWFAAPSGPDGPVRPERGPQTNPAATAALMRLVEALERSRYARDTHPGVSAELRRDTEECVAGLRAGFYRKARRRADWWPASAFQRLGHHDGARGADGAATDRGAADRMGSR
ncbi:DUF3488 and transglutaminase-like domain-containing protein [Nocardioides sp.]|uniref:transglutaminase family protein n=1 Tax=Nocardioides sp. TaxID=35761 RepID=UPI0027359203|nr:DUF3488 and transglutaminase-like domain-containing protein [Nocardioides sp.]MDP3889708.1 DUF3488 and transglutaminase-like domain-containing protein [Nocardioides sp.]